MDIKISQLPQAGTPLIGGETVIVNQSGNTHITQLSSI